MKSSIVLIGKRKMTRDEALKVTLHGKEAGQEMKRLCHASLGRVLVVRSFRSFSRSF